MALTATEEAQLRQLITQQAALLSLAGNEATITSKLGAAKVNLGQLPAASALADADLLLTRQGVNDRSLTASLLAQYISAELGVTAPQFDNDTSLATTAFVQRALGNKGDYRIIGATETLTAADAGKLLVAQGAGSISLTLPLLSAVPLGAVIEIQSQSGSAVSVLRQSTDLISASNINNALTSVAILDGDSASFIKSTSQWMMASGAAVLKYTSSFLASLTASGYQKLPSGLIIQWGTIPAITANSSVTVTFPIAFPTGLLAVSGISGATSVLAAGINTQGVSTSQQKFWNSSASVATLAGTYLAIGY